MTPDKESTMFETSELNPRLFFLHINKERVERVRNKVRVG